MSQTKIYRINGTNLEVEEMSNGYTTLWQGDEKILGVYQPTHTSQKKMTDKIKTLFPEWIMGDVTRKQ